MAMAEVQAEIAATKAAMTALRAAVGTTFMARMSQPVSGPDGETAAERLRAFRAERKLSQRALGAAIDYAQGYITDIETGRSEPSREFARKMAEAYGVSADWLLFGRGGA